MEELPIQKQIAVDLNAAIEQEIEARSKKTEYTLDAPQAATVDSEINSEEDKEISVVAREKPGAEAEINSDDELEKKVLEIVQTKKEKYFSMLQDMINGQRNKGREGDAKDTEKLLKNQALGYQTIENAGLPFMLEYVKENIDSKVDEVAQIEKKIGEFKKKISDLGGICLYPIFSIAETKAYLEMKGIKAAEVDRIDYDDLFFKYLQPEKAKIENDIISDLLQEYPDDVKKYLNFQGTGEEYTKTDDYQVLRNIVDPLLAEMVYDEYKKITANKQEVGNMEIEFSSEQQRVIEIMQSKIMEFRSMVQQLYKDRGEEEHLTDNLMIGLLEERASRLFALARDRQFFAPEQKEIVLIEFLKEKL
jgi:hypothetical protein